MNYESVCNRESDTNQEETQDLLIQNEIEDQKQDKNKNLKLTEKESKMKNSERERNSASEHISIGIDNIILPNDNNETTLINSRIQKDQSKEYLNDVNNVVSRKRSSECNSSADADAENANDLVVCSNDSKSDSKERQSQTQTQDTFHNSIQKNPSKRNKVESEAEEVANLKNKSVSSALSLTNQIFKNNSVQYKNLYEIFDKGSLKASFTHLTL